MSQDLNKVADQLPDKKPPSVWLNALCHRQSASSNQTVRYKALTTTITPMATIPIPPSTSSPPPPPLSSISWFSGERRNELSHSFHSWVHAFPCKSTSHYALVYTAWSKPLQINKCKLRPMLKQMQPQAISQGPPNCHCFIYCHCFTCSQIWGAHRKCIPENLSEYM